MTTKLSELNVIETQDGYYLNFPYHDKYFFDGKNAKKTFHSEWSFVESLPQKVEILTPQPNINHRYELIDKSFLSDKVKDVFKREEVAEYDKYEYEWVWKDEFYHLKSLYKLVSDKQDDILVPIDFNINIIYRIDKIKEQNDFSYTISTTQLGSSGTKQITQENIKHQLMDEILFPDIILSFKKCKLSSKETYDIVRQHIINNINSKYAKITSDYDFCFTVQKRIELAEPEKYSIDVNNQNIFSKRKRKPKYETRYRKDRTVKIFEMTHEEANYQGYIAIKGFIGDNQTDLKNKIDTFLKDIIEFINEPLVECKVCGGNGVILDKFNINKSRGD